MTPPVPRYLEHPTPEQLTEIYHLRVTAWAPDPAFDANQHLDGLFDALDPTAHHWVIEEDGCIVAAARVAVVEKLTEIPNWQMYEQCQLPDVSPIAYLSRLVVHPKHQRRGWSEHFDAARLLYVDQAEIPLTVCLIDSRRMDVLRQLNFVFAGLADTRYHFYNSTTFVYFRLHPKLKSLTLANFI